MNFKDLMGKMTELSEAKEKTATGIKHKGSYGTEYQGVDDDESSDDKKKPKAKTTQPKEKRALGRPKKGADDNGKVADYKNAASLQSFMVGNLPKGKLPGAAGKVHKASDKESKASKSLKDWIENLDTALNEALTTQSVPSSRDPVTGAVTPPSVIVKDTSKPMGQQQVATTATQQAASDIVSGKTVVGNVAPTKPGAPAAKTATPGSSVSEGEMDEAFDAKMKTAKKDIGMFKGWTIEKLKAAKNKLMKQEKRDAADQKRVRQLTFAIRAKQEGEGKWGKVKEADMPPSDSLMSPISEGKMKELDADIKDKAMDAIDKNTKKTAFEKKYKMTKAEARAELKKDKAHIKESADHCTAAYHLGKAHGMGESKYACPHAAGSPESKRYHEGFKEGLDECHGSDTYTVGEEALGRPVQSMAPLINRRSMMDEVDSMTSTPAYEGHEINELGDIGKKVTGYRPTAPENVIKIPAAMRKEAGRTSTKNRFPATLADIQRNPHQERFAQRAEKLDQGDISWPQYESWNKQLESLLNEGITVSTSTGQHGAPDSVSINATDNDAGELMAVLKSAGMGIFGGSDAKQDTGMMSAVPADVMGGAAIEVVDDHDDMLSLIRKMTGQGAAQSSDDYAEEETHSHDSHDHMNGDEEEHAMAADCDTCPTCESDPCECDDQVSETETDDQREFQVAEDEMEEGNAFTGKLAHTKQGEKFKLGNKTYTDTSSLEEDSDEAEDSIEEESEEELEESFANSTDNTCEVSEEYMMDGISGGLNGKKSTGQSTIPVVSSQEQRLGAPVRESLNLLHDWKTLAGIK